MTNFILLIFLILLCFTFRALFNEEFRSAAQGAINAVGKERRFWYTVRGESVYGCVLGIESIYYCYLENLIRKFDVPARTDAETKILKMISKKGNYENLRIIERAIEKVELTITEELVTRNKSFMWEEVKSAFDAYRSKRFSMALLDEKPNPVIVSYDRYVSYYFNLYFYWSDYSGSLKGVDLWEHRKLVEKEQRLREGWWGGKHKISKKADITTAKILANILCGQDETTAVLKCALTDREHLVMLLHCLQDFLMWRGTNRFTRWGWIVLANIAQ